MESGRPCHGMHIGQSETTRGEGTGRWTHTGGDVRSFRSRHRFRALKPVQYTLDPPSSPGTRDHPDLSWAAKPEPSRTPHNQLTPSTNQQACNPPHIHPTETCAKKSTRREHSHRGSTRLTRKRYSDAMTKPRDCTEAPIVAAPWLSRRRTCIKVPVVDCSCASELNAMKAIASRRSSSAASASPPPSTESAQVGWPAIFDVKYQLQRPKVAYTFPSLLLALPATLCPPVNSCQRCSDSPFQHPSVL